MVLSYGAFLPLDLTLTNEWGRTLAQTAHHPQKPRLCGCDALENKAVHQPAAGPAGQKRQCVRHPGLSRRTYADSLLPAAYDSFLEEAATVMQPRHHRMMRKLLDFRFDRRATRYNLPANRLAMIEQEIRRRASWLLK